jgi:cytosine deaminase
VGAEEYMRSQGIAVEVVQDPECIALMERFIREKPELWHEDIGI